jgi:hypothetical protein
LAEVYHDAAIAVAGLGRKGDPISRAPYRMVAIHAVELYLNALLLHAGYEPSRIRALHHDMAARTDLSVKCGLLLRRKTEAHLRAIAESREYLVTRYGPERITLLSEINRLAATLEEVAAKVRVNLSRAVQCGPHPASVRAPHRVSSTAMRAARPPVSPGHLSSGGGDEARI